MVSALDQARACSAEHHRTEQWRIRIPLAAQVSSCAPKQGHAERLALRSVMKDSHALLQKACLFDEDGKTRHIDVRFLWLQQAAQEGCCEGSQCPDKSQSLSQVAEDRCCLCF